MRLQLSLCLFILTATLPLTFAAEKELPSNKKLGTIFNDDGHMILYIIGRNTGWNIELAKADLTPDVYRQYLECLMELNPGVLSQTVGYPEAVLYPTKVDNDITKHYLEVCYLNWPEDWEKTGRNIQTIRNLGWQQLFAAGTDLLQLAVEVGRKRGVLVVASYRMNGEDWYGHTYKLSDFGRAHPEYLISGCGCLDPAIPAVYEHRMKIFAEVASKYDIDGIEFDFRRWYHMVSNPEKNHVVLTRMVREARKMLDETAKRKGCKRLLLGVRVGPMLEGTFKKEDFPGCVYGELTNASCKTLGLDVRTWVKERLVDYISPMLFEPMSLPRTKEFAELVKGTDIGIYPTLSFTPCGATALPIGGQPDNAETRRRHRVDICTEALKCYDEGADGVSLYNWPAHCYPPPGKDQFPHTAGIEQKCPKCDWAKVYNGSALGFGRVQQEVMPKLSSPVALRELLHAP
jgi:hypothetical protein